jgi:hypothetical protein
VIAQASYPVGRLDLPEGKAVLTLAIETPSGHGGDAFKKGIEKIIIQKVK